MSSVHFEQTSFAVGFGHPIKPSENSVRTSRFSVMKAKIFQQNQLYRYRNVASQTHLFVGDCLEPVLILYAYIARRTQHDTEM